MINNTYVLTFREIDYKTQKFYLIYILPRNNIKLKSINNDAKNQNDLIKFKIQNDLTKFKPKIDTKNQNDLSKF